MVVDIQMPEKFKTIKQEVLSERLNENIESVLEIIMLQEDIPYASEEEQKECVNILEDADCHSTGKVKTICL